MDKVLFRKTLLQQRRSLSKSAWQAKSLRLCQHLQTWDVFQQATTVLAYCSIAQEPDLQSLFVGNSQTVAPKRWGLPRCVGQQLVWHQWQPNQSPLRSGRFGIPEPDLHSPQIEVAAVDLILVPCVACDRRGYRLGYGGGFYDRLLSQTDWRHKPTLGIVFQFAVLDALPIEVWDQPLDGICTETGIIHHPGGQSAIF